MRPLTDDELKAFFEKLSKYIGGNIKFLLEGEGEPHVFRLLHGKVYYMSKQLEKLSTNFGKDELIQYAFLWIFLLTSSVLGLASGNSRKLGSSKCTLQPCLSLPSSPLTKSG